MAKWNAGVGLQLTIDYDDIEADTEAEAIQIAKERALEDIEWTNCDCDASNPIVPTESTWRNNWRELTVIKKAKRRSREKALSEMLFMMFRSAARDRYKLS